VFTITTEEVEDVLVLPKIRTEEDLILHFNQGNRVVTVSSNNENIVSVEIDPKYCAQLIMINVQIAEIYSSIHLLTEPGKVAATNKLIELKKEYQILLERIATTYFKDQVQEIKNPFHISVNTLSNMAFFFNIEKPLTFPY